MRKPEKSHIERLRKPLTDLMRWFSETGLRGAIVGGVAASLRGQPRLTKDIDAVVFTSDAEELIETASQFGFAPRVSDAAQFAHTSRVLLLEHTATGIPIDIALGALPFENEMIERATSVDVGDLVIRVASSEDLIIMKAVPRRPRDLGDIESLIATNPDLDLGRIRHWVREFSAVLEMPEIYDDLEKLLQRRGR